MLIPLPIGLWVFSLVSDVIFRAGWGSPVWYDVAFYTMFGGVIGALLAAVPGLIDLLSIQNPKTKKIAIWHMVLNLTAVVVYCINLWLRTRNDPMSNSPFLLSIAGIILICISGWLGGELVYVRCVGVDRPADRNP
jgi:uncharacterized membrane protein